MLQLPGTENEFIYLSHILPLDKDVLFSKVKVIFTFSFCENFADTFLFLLQNSFHTLLTLHRTW